MQGQAGLKLLELLLLLPPDSWGDRLMVLCLALLIFLTLVFSPTKNTLCESEDSDLRTAKVLVPGTVLSY